MVRYIKYESVLPSVGTVDPNEPKVIPEWTQIKKTRPKINPTKTPKVNPELGWCLLYCYVGSDRYCTLVLVARSTHASNHE